MSSASSPVRSESSLGSVAAIWLLAFLVSAGPNIIFQERTGTNPGWLLGGKIALLVSVLLAGFFVEAARPMRHFCAVLLTVCTVDRTSLAVSGTTVWSHLFPNRSFVAGTLGTQLQRFGLALAVLALLLVLKRRPDRFYLRAGELSARVQPGWLRLFGKPIRWRLFGPIVGLCSSIGTLLFLNVAGGPTPSLSSLGVLLVWILLFSAMNAFSEELVFRNALLSALEPAAGTGQALLVSSAIFGLGHFYGVPYGTVGVLMASVFGYVLAKAMVETKGMFWPWIIHLVQDCFIFSFMAVGSIRAGGR